MAEGGHQPSPPRASPPKAVVDTSPLLNSLEQNKQSLKNKLMTRRPLDQLVEQGIMAPSKTPAIFHNQRRQLERAKTGDMLKNKIQQRPSRQELERRHILESDPAHLDPSLAEKQRMLKKARLADQLNDQLSHRPGPLELIQKNILHTEEPIEHMVKAGRIPYKATCEGNLNRPQHPSVYINPEDDSQSSEDNNLVSPGPSDVIETAAKSAGIVVPLTEGLVVVTTSGTAVLSKDNSEIVYAPLIPHRTASSPASLVSSTSTLSPLSSIASPVPSVVSQPATPIPPPLPSTCYTPRSIQSSTGKSDAPGKDKNRKKSKSKSTPKTRTIKFHEYKGPPSAQKSSANAANASGESSYDLLLQQQTLLLQFQLQFQHKYPQLILPASQKNQLENNNNNNSNSSNLNNPQPSPSTSTTSESSSNACRLTTRLEDMKVSELKAELKRRNLPVSGSKPQLIDRLKPFTNSEAINMQNSNIMAGMVDTSCSKSIINDDSQHSSPLHNDVGSPHTMLEEPELMDVSSPLSPLPQPIQVQTLPAHIIKTEPHDFNDDIVKKQQRQIEELQRELTLSQMKLEAATRAESKTQLLALQKQIARQQQQQIVDQVQMQQALKARQVEEQQRLQQQQHVAFQNQKNLGGGILLNGLDASLVLNQLVQGNKKLLNGHSRINSLPNFFNSLVTPIIAVPEIKTEYEEDIKPPPLYEEVTKKEKNNVKSQIVDDVLEILIKNGELPPSAAIDPSTPGSAGTRNAEPVYPNSNQVHNPQQSQQPQQIDSNGPEAVLGLEAVDFLEDTLENMDINQLVMELGQQSNDNVQNNNETIPVPMDTDDWLVSLLPSSDTHTHNHHHHQNNINIIQNHLSNHHNHQQPQQENTTSSSDLGGYDPLLGIAQGPFDPFCLEDFRSTPEHVSWDYTS